MGERDTQKAILDYLAAKRILAFRMNTGAMKAEYKGKMRFMRFGVPGTADVLAFPKAAWNPETRATLDYWNTLPVWIEVKDLKGKQTEVQKSFEALVVMHGHRYILARSLEDVKEVIG